MPENAEKLEALSAYLDGELSEPQRRQVEALLRDSAQARGLLEQLRGVRRLVAELPRDAAGTRFTESVLAKLERQSLLGEAAEFAGQARSPSAWGRGWAIAAGFVLMFGAGGLYWYLPRGSSTATSLLHERDVIQLADGEVSSGRTAAESKSSLGRAESAKVDGQSEPMSVSPKGVESPSPRLWARAKSPEMVGQVRTNESPAMAISADAKDTGGPAFAGIHPAPDASTLASAEASLDVHTLVVSVDESARQRMQAAIARAGQEHDQTQSEQPARVSIGEEEAAAFAWTGEAAQAAGLIDELASIDVRRAVGARWTLDGVQVPDADAVRAALGLAPPEAAREAAIGESRDDGASDASPSRRPEARPIAPGAVPASQSTRPSRLRIRLQPLPTSQPTSREADHE